MTIATWIIIDEWSTEEGAGSAVFSGDRVYRYSLARTWDWLLPRCTFVMLNPSTADAQQDDPTIRRCIGYAKAWGYGGLEVVNIFAYRATKRKELYPLLDPIGPENMTYVIGAAKRGAKVICAWGIDGKFRDQGRKIIRALREAGVEIYCLTTTDGGEPGHPLYLKADLKPVLL